MIKLFNISFVKALNFTKKSTFKIRNFSTSKIHCSSSSCLALVDYKNKFFLEPILKIQDKLLVPIVFNTYILNEIQYIQYIISRFPNSNFVLHWLISQLKQNNFIINAEINKEADKLLNKIKKIENETVIRGYIGEITEYSVYQIISREFNEIKLDNDKGKPLFKFYLELDTILSKSDFLRSDLYAGCYIITFRNRYYYYIGSSTNLKNRLKNHTSNINNFILGKNYTLSDFFKFYLISELNYLLNKRKRSEEDKNLNFEINILYLSTNYLNLFSSLYPDYKLNKGEWILLKKLTDFYIKILEASLINKFNPKLNSTNKTVFKSAEWSDEYLEIFNEKEFLKNKKYNIYVLKREFFSIFEDYDRLKLEYFKNPSTFNYTFKKLKISDRPVRSGTLGDLCYRYNLKPYEVLNNLNRFHNYESNTLLKNPLKIIERNFSTSKLSFYNNNEQCVALVRYEDKNFLKPILKVQNKLLAPIVYDENILNFMEYIQFLLSKLPESNLVKLWLKMELEKDKIIINAEKSKDCDALLKKIYKINIMKTNEEIYEEIEFLASENIFSFPEYFFNEIEREDLLYKSQGLFIYKNDNPRLFNIKLDNILNEKIKKNKLRSQCYIITFDNKAYYYIGCSIRFEDRIREHIRNIKNHLKFKETELNIFFKYFLESENYFYNTQDNKIKNKFFTLNFNILYLSTNYLDKFQEMYPNYILSKGEWIILYMITDLLIKTLENSLFKKFKPILNMEKKVVFRYFDWEDYYLKTFNKSGKASEFLKARRYNIYIDYNRTESEANIFLNNIFIKSKKKSLSSLVNLTHKTLIKNVTFHKFCTTYKLNKKEVINNLNRFHCYKGAIIKEPLMIIKLKEKK